jgi:hypothetical protein
MLLNFACQKKCCKLRKKRHNSKFFGLGKEAKRTGLGRI